MKGRLREAYKNLILNDAQKFLENHDGEHLAPLREIVEACEKTQKIPKFFGLLFPSLETAYYEAHDESLFLRIGLLVECKALTKPKMFKQNRNRARNRQYYYQY